MTAAIFLLGLAAMAWGILASLAGMMSDAPTEGASAVKDGCTWFVVGAVMAIGAALYWLFT